MFVSNRERNQMKHSEEGNTVPVKSRSHYLSRRERNRRKHAETAILQPQQRHQTIGKQSSSSYRTGLRNTSDVRINARQMLKNEGLQSGL